MRFDLVDLQLFVAVADSGSITHGAVRANLALASASARIKGLEAGLRGVPRQAPPPRHRADRGRRKPSRSREGDHAQCRDDAGRSRKPSAAASGQASICSPIPPGCRSICRRRSRPSCANIPTSASTWRSAKAPILSVRSPAARPTSALRPNTRCPSISNGFHIRRRSPDAGGAAARRISRAAARSISST